MQFSLGGEIGLITHLGNGRYISWYLIEEIDSVRGFIMVGYTAAHGERITRIFNRFEMIEHIKLGNCIYAATEQEKLFANLKYNGH